MRTRDFQPGAKGIIGRFDKQRWTGTKEDRAESIGEVEFDATDYILSMPLTKLRQVEDCSESSDAIGTEHVDHDGPFSVCIEQAICEFFQVQAVADITPQLFQRARKWLNSLPPTRYSARLSVTTFIDVPLQARHPSQVKKLALENRAARSLAGNVEFVGASSILQAKQTAALQSNRKHAKGTTIRRGRSGVPRAGDAKQRRPEAAQEAQVRKLEKPSENDSQGVSEGQGDQHQLRDTPVI